MVPKFWSLKKYIYLKRLAPGSQILVYFKIFFVWRISGVETCLLNASSI